MNFSFEVLLLYGKNSENFNNFYENPIKINTHQNFDIILGDFNVSTFEQNSQVKQVLSNFMQVVNRIDTNIWWLIEPYIYSQTHESGDDCVTSGYYNIFQ